MKNGLTIKKANYLNGYKIEITFSDGKVNVFDYENLVMREHEGSIPYRDIEKFKEFEIISNTEIAWGENWDMILPLHTIYSKTKVSNSGRKKVSDKKELLRLYVNKSVIEANGGLEVSQEKCLKLLNTVH